MAFKIVSCTKGVDGYRFRVHLDTEKPDSEEWLQEWTWGLPQPGLHMQHERDLTEKQYLENIAAMLPGMVELELARRRNETHHDAARVTVKALHGKTVQ